MELVVETEVDWGVQLALDSHVLERIQDNYLQENPIVVLVIMGAQGTGKSTLLNNIIQFCTKWLELPNIFPLGNTTKHTTKGSQVLSHPLFYEGRQIMLIDLEGLGGTETEWAAKAVIQENLISALLTVASVPCILITNTRADLIFVENTVTTLAKLQTDFGFISERIYLLFHDKELRRDEAGENIHREFAQLVIKLNRTTFNGRVVIKILNKPNFKNQDLASQRQLFVQTLLNDSLYAKKSISKVDEKIQELLTLINVITRHKTTNVSEAKLNDIDKKRMEEVITRKKGELRTIQTNTRSQNDHSLLAYFNATLRNEFIVKTEQEMRSMDDYLKEYCRVKIELELHLIKAELMEIEALYSSIRCIDETL